MIIRMRLRAGAAIPGRLSTHPLCPRSPGTGPSEQSTTQQQRRTRLPPAAPTTKSPAQDGISIESHPRSSTEPRRSPPSPPPPRRTSNQSTISSPPVTRAASARKRDRRGRSAHQHPPSRCRCSERCRRRHPHLNHRQPRPSQPAKSSTAKSSDSPSQRPADNGAGDSYDRGLASAPTVLTAHVEQRQRAAIVVARGDCCARRAATASTAAA